MNHHRVGVRVIVHPLITFVLGFLLCFPFWVQFSRTSGTLIRLLSSCYSHSLTIVLLQSFDCLKKNELKNNSEGVKVKPKTCLVYGVWWFRFLLQWRNFYCDKSCLLLKFFATFFKEFICNWWDACRIFVMIFLKGVVWMGVMVQCYFFPQGMLTLSAFFYCFVIAINLKFLFFMMMIFVEEKNCCSFLWRCC